MACDYKHCDGPSLAQEKSEVYVWGSNSSHQLAEGLQEKILMPKLTRSFTNVQQVISKLKKNFCLHFLYNMEYNFDALGFHFSHLFGKICIFEKTVMLFIL